MSLEKEFGHLKIQLEDIKLATNNFAHDNCIGKGGFGKVYKGEIVHSKGLTVVALKRLDRSFGQGDPEFWKEIIMLSLYRHENIGSLLGFCDDSGEKILVYEYACKRSLDLYLNIGDLTWAQRLKICIGVARGLAYLHTSFGTQQRVLHRDIKSSNILLDENWNAKISDLGLSKFGPANQRYTFLVSNVVGTIGYCDPQYVETGLLTKESDVYSFGVVLFEVLCGRLCIDHNNTSKHQPLTGLVRQCYEGNRINEIVFSNIKDEIDPGSLMAFTTIAYQCLNRDREERPLMTDIIKVLEIALEYQEIKTQNQQENYIRNDDNDMKLHFFRTEWDGLELEEILKAKANMLDYGSFGISYKVKLSGGKTVVYKKLRRIFNERKEDFQEYLMLMGSLSHPNLLPLVACFFEKNKKMLITDFAVNNSLDVHLNHKRKNDKLGLDWETRLKILKGVVRGLDYLYQELPHLSLPHGHLKSSNVLLDDDFNTLLTNYALLPVINKKHAQQVMMAYKSPEITQHHIITKTTDVWCLGILILEMMTRKFQSSDENDEFGEPDLRAWVNSVVREEWADEVFDKDLKRSMNCESEMVELLEIGLCCCEMDPVKRWDMDTAIEKIVGLDAKE